MRKFDKSLRDLFYYLLSGAVSRLFPLLFLPLIASKLSENAFGLFSLYRLYITLGATLLLLGIEQALFRLLPGKSEEEKDQLTGTALWFVSASGVIFLLLFLGGAHPIQTLLFRRHFTLPAILLPLMIVFNSISTILITRYSAEKKSRKYFTINLVRTVVFFTLFALGLLLHYKLTAYFVSFFTAELLVYLVCLPLIIKSLKHGIRLVHLRPLFRIGLPLLGVMLTTLLLYQSDHYLIKFFRGIEATGIYNYGYRFAAAIGSFVLLSNNVWLPRLYERGETFLEKNLREYAALITLAGETLYMGLLIVFYIFRKILIPPGFSQAWQVIIIAGFGYLFYAHAQLMDSWYILKNKNRSLLGISFSILVLNLILNFLFIPRYGLIAAAWTSTVSFAVLWLFLIIYLKKTEKNYRFRFITIDFLVGLLPAVFYLVFSSLWLSMILYAACAWFLLRGNRLFRRILLGR